jgi:hypothetical protein
MRVMSTAAKFRITVPQRDENGMLTEVEKIYYVTLVADSANCEAGDIQVSPVNDSTEFEAGDAIILPNSGVMPPQEPPRALMLVAN